MKSIKNLIIDSTNAPKFNLKACLLFEDFGLQYNLDELYESIDYHLHEGVTANEKRSNYNPHHFVV